MTRYIINFICRPLSSQRSGNEKNVKRKDEEETFDVVVTFCTNTLLWRKTIKHFRPGFSGKKRNVCLSSLLSFKSRHIIEREIEGNTYGFMATRFLPFYIFLDSLKTLNITSLLLNSPDFLFRITITMIIKNKMLQSSCCQYKCI